MVEVPAVRRAGLSAQDHAALAGMTDCWVWFCRTQLALLPAVREQGVISQEAYLGLLARGDQLHAAVTELASRYGAPDPLAG